MSNSKIKSELVEELSQQYFIIEGIVTDLLTHETLENINQKIQPLTEKIAIGSAILGQLGTAVTTSFAASDEGIDVSVFAVEITDYQDKKHYFKGCFPEIVFKVGDQVQVIAERIEGENNFARAVSMIDIKKGYMWTSQEVARGRLRYRLWGLKIVMWGLVFTFIFFITLAYLKSGRESALFNDIGAQIIFFICILIFGFIGWRVGASFDEQSIELEAILLKIGFHKPTMTNLYEFSVFNVMSKNNEKIDGYSTRWADYTYRLDLAQKADADKYGKK